MLKFLSFERAGKLCARKACSWKFKIEVLNNNIQLVAATASSGPSGSRSLRDSNQISRRLSNSCGSSKSCRVQYRADLVFLVAMVAQPMFERSVGFSES